MTRSLFCGCGTAIKTLGYKISKRFLRTEYGVQGLAFPGLGRLRSGSRIRVPAFYNMVKLVSAAAPSACHPQPLRVLSPMAVTNGAVYCS